MSGAAPGAVLRIAAAVIRDEAGRVLVVRKRGTEAFMQPGGKLEPGEAPERALVRELEEELGLVVSPADLAVVGRFDAVAANEADTRVDAWVYDAPLTGEPVAAAEIAELRWIDPADESLPLAPLHLEVVAPHVRGSR